MTRVQCSGRVVRPHVDLVHENKFPEGLKIRSSFLQGRGRRKNSRVRRFSRIYGNRERARDRDLSFREYFLPVSFCFGKGFSSGIVLLLPA